MSKRRLKVTPYYYATTQKHRKTSVIRKNVYICIVLLPGRESRKTLKYNNM